MTVRSRTPALTPLLEILEVEQPRVVTRPQLEAWARDAGVRWPINVTVQRLRERGWLLGLKTRGVWEFVPAARGGAYGSGDPLIELRATLACRPDAPFAVAGESAAHLLGFASSRPDREAVSAPPGRTVPPALRDFRIIRWDVRTPPLERDGLPVWSASTLLACVAARPALLTDVGVAEWLRRVAETSEGELLRAELEGRPRSAWARAAYLLDLAGEARLARELISAGPGGDGPFHLGPRDRHGKHSAQFDVVDSLGLYEHLRPRWSTGGEYLGGR